MSELKKDGIRAVMSEQEERDALKLMGQRFSQSRQGETVSNDKVKQDAPKLIYLHNPWNVEQAPCGCNKDIPYVPETLLATVRKEAFKEAVEAIEKLVCPAQFEGNWRNGYSHAQNDAYRAIEHLAALEAKKGEGNG